jgi:hypothetical protein
MLGYRANADHFAGAVEVCVMDLSGSQFAAILDCAVESSLREARQLCESVTKIPVTEHCIPTEFLDSLLDLL